MPGTMPLAGGPLAGARVLIVEDTDDSREMLAEFMRLFSLEVEEARSGREAFEKFRTKPPSLVVSDIAMPDGDGLSLMKAIRGLPAEEGGLTPAIAVSAGLEPDEAILAGFHVYLQKPVDPVKLLEVIRNFLEPMSPQAPAHAASTLHAPRSDLAVLRFTGHVGAVDVQRVIDALALHLEREPMNVVADLRGVVSWDPSAVSHAQRGVWGRRRRIQSLVLVGGPRVSRLLSLAAARLLGIPARVEDEMPSL